MSMAENEPIPPLDLDAAIGWAEAWEKSRAELAAGPILMRKKDAENAFHRLSVITAGSVPALVEEVKRLTLITSRAELIANSMDHFASVAERVERRNNELVAERDAAIARAEAEERAHGDTIDDRDQIHEAADRIAYSLASIEEIGEHSSGNDPWDNVIDHVHGKFQRLETERDEALAKVAAARNECARIEKVAVRASNASGEMLLSRSIAARIRAAVGDGAHREGGWDELAAVLARLHDPEVHESGCDFGQWGYEKIADDLRAALTEVQADAGDACPHQGGKPLNCALCAGVSS